jgi:uncharacterized coiled-coil protein SlyX
MSVAKGDGMTCELHEHTEKRVDSMMDMVVDMEKRLASLETDEAISRDRIKRIFEDIEAMRVLIAGIADKMDKIAAKPGLRWESLVNALIAAGAGAFLVQMLK